MIKKSSQLPLQIKTTSFYSSSLNNFSPQSPRQNQVHQSPLSYTPLEDNNSSPNPNKRPTFPSIFSFSRSNSRVKRHRSEIYQEKDEYTNGCFGYFRTSGSKIKYKVNDFWKRIRVNYERKFSKKKRHCEHY
ncbi:hypothetical protein RclHR1_00340028 [Rhizophagus clarus]|uniref:Uncharacterized protein n=1 Tax=Rhizophagus clarus TaxID=94130 RepID=A0A2Z6R9H8_9GLOM|nr:hypothetical protein RclHR1_00340028 [Rhizophagus clarus]GES92848.1 hypothetical protein GLOIN_2v1493921 [Rhizophagus clarus]